MSVTYVGSNSVAWNGATGGSITAPGGILAGDILIISAVNGNGASQTITWPSGFTAVTSNVGTSSNTSKTMGFAWKKSTGSEPGSYAVSFSASDFGCAAISIYRGCDPTTPINVFSAGHVLASTQPSHADASSISTTIDGCMLVWAGGCWDIGAGNGITSMGSPSGYTSRQAPITSPTFSNLNLADFLQSSHGATGTVTGAGAPTSVTADSAAFILALAPLVITPTATIAWVI